MSCPSHPGMTVQGWSNWRIKILLAKKNSKCLKVRVGSWNTQKCSLNFTILFFSWFFASYFQKAKINFRKKKNIKGFVSTPFHMAKELTIGIKKKPWKHVNYFPLHNYVLCCRDYRTCSRRALKASVLTASPSGEGLSPSGIFWPMGRSSVMPKRSEEF
jgi:hypothetical protein